LCAFGILGVSRGGLDSKDGGLGSCDKNGGGNGL